MIETKVAFKKNMIFMMASVGGVQILNFLLYSFMAHRLSTEMFGLVNLSQTVLVYFTLLTMFGLQTLGAKEVSKRENKDEMVGEVISLRLGVALFSMLIIFFIAPVFAKGEIFKNMLMIFSLTLIPLAFNFSWFYAGIYDMKFNGIYNILKIAVPFLFIIILLKGDSTVRVVPIGFFLGVFIAGVVHLFFFLKKGYRIRRGRSKLYRVAFPFVLGSILATINGNVDTLMIGRMLDNESLGLYTSAYKLVYFLLGITTAAFGVIYPLLARYEGDKRQKLFDSLIKIGVILGIPVSIGGVVFAEEIITLLFGSNKIAGAASLRILMVYFMILLFREIMAYSLNAWDLEKTYTRIITISAVGNIVINSILVKTMGIEGAAVSTLIMEIFTFILMIVQVKSMIKVDLKKEIVGKIPGLALGIIIMGVFKVLNLSILVTVPAVGIIYLGLIYKMGYIDFILELR